MATVKGKIKFRGEGKIMLVQNFLEMASKESPAKPAVWYKNQWRTYKEIEDQANQVGHFLIENGLERGERVAMLLENSFLFVSIYFGILKAGGVVVGLNTDITSDDLEYLLTNSDAAFLFIGKTKFSLWAKKKTDMRGVVLCDENSGEGNEDDFRQTEGVQVPFHIFSAASGFPVSAPKTRQIDLDLAEIVYTSGSTGVPKGVMLSHLNLVSNMHSIAEYLYLCSDDRIMVVLPFTYIYGKSLLLTHVLAKASMVIDNRFVYPAKIIDTMKQTEVTGFAGVPSTFSILLKRTAIRDHSFPKLRYVTQAGGHMATGLQKEVVDAFSPAVLYVMYGATEAAPRLSYLEPDMLSQKLGSIGIPVPNVELRIVDEDGREVSTGMEGEIVARGSNIMMGYWKDPEGTAGVLRKGFYFTGDLGKQDEDGYFYVVGRKKNIIKVKGYRVSAKEIEEKILALEDVVETAVIGVEDAVLGEAIKAFVVCREGSKLSVRDVLSHLKSHVSGYKLPKYIEFRDELPKNKSGKIMKTVLAAAESKE